MYGYGLVQAQAAMDYLALNACGEPTNGDADSSYSDDPSGKKWGGRLSGRTQKIRLIYIWKNSG